MKSLVAFLFGAVVILWLWSSGMIQQPPQHKQGETKSYVNEWGRKVTVDNDK